MKSEFGKIEDRFGFLLIAVFLLFCIIFGGSSNQPGINTTIIVIFAISIFVRSAFLGGIHQFRMLNLRVKIAFFAIVLIPIVQLVPLPPFIWQMLPGREVSTEIRTALDMSDNWYPLSLDPIATAFTWFQIWPGLAAFLTWLVIGEQDRKFVILLLMTGGLLTILTGLIQFASAGELLDFFDNSHRGNFQGFYANRNHAALFLTFIFVVSIFSHRIFPVKRRENELKIKLAALTMAFLSGLAVLTTFSRSGLGLLLIAVSISFLSGQLFQLRNKKILVSFIVLVWLVVISALQFSNVNTLLERFNTIGDDSRFGYWAMTWDISLSYFPVGSGLGTFVPVFAMNEALTDLAPTYANHAHNEYLEILMETGVLGVCLILIVLVEWILNSVRIFHNKEDETDFEYASIYQWLGMIITTLFLLHNFFDYPLRTASGAILFGFAAAMLVERNSRKLGKIGPVDN